MSKQSQINVTILLIALAGVLGGAAGILRGCRVDQLERRIERLERER